MPHTAVFLGAGASCMTGHPLTSQILPAVLESVEAGEFPELGKVLRASLPGLRASATGELGITGLLSLIDYSIQNDLPLLPGQSSADLRLVRNQLEQAILRFIDPYEAYKREERSRIKELGDWFKSLRKSSDAVSVLSTNYDMSADLALLDLFDSDDAVGEYVDFGTAWREPIEGYVYQRPQNPRYRLLKLHGSANWLVCRQCQQLYVNTETAIAHIAFLLGPDHEDAQCHCGHSRLEALLVTPSYVRTFETTILASIWRAAIEALRTADHWYFIGYSLPPEDIAIRSLLIRARQAHRSKNGPDVTVVQRSRKAEPGYRQLFPDLKYHDGGIEAFITQHRAG
jgi:hypothetical protein